MNLHLKLQKRAAENKPIRVGLIGAGKFGSMYLAQIPRTPGVHLAGIAPACHPTPPAPTLLASAGPTSSPRPRRWTKPSSPAPRTWARTVRRWFATRPSNVIVECICHPIAAVDHCLEAFAHGKHVVNVTVEADAFCGRCWRARRRKPG